MKIEIMHTNPTYYLSKYTIVLPLKSIFTIINCYKIFKNQKAVILKKKIKNSFESNWFWQMRQKFQIPFTVCSTLTTSLVRPQWWSFADVSQQGVDFSKKISKIEIFIDLTFTDVHTDRQKFILGTKVVQFWSYQKMYF